MTAISDRHDDDVDTTVEEVRVEFIARFATACATIARLIDDAPAAMSESSLPQLTHTLHRMAGLAGTIGFPTVSERARELEDLVRDAPAGALDIDRARELLDAIRQALDEDRSR